MSGSKVCVIDTDSSIGIKSCFRSAVRCTTYHFHISFLETCKQFNVYPSEMTICFICFKRVNSKLGRDDTNHLKSTSGNPIDGNQRKTH